MFRRAALLWLLLFAAYAGTVGIDSFRASDYGGDEPHYLLTAESIVSDGDFDLTDEYRTRAYADWYPDALEADGKPTAGRLHEPHGIGFALLIAPAYALGGPTLVELFVAALAALGFVAAWLLARRLVPEPWALMGALSCALSAPVLAYGSAVYPELVAGGALAWAALWALKVRDEPRARWAYAAALALASLPWLGTKFALPGLLVAALLVRWTLRRGRRLVALVAGELMLASGVAYLTLNEGLYGGPTPYSANPPGNSATGAEFPLGYLERVPRLVSLWIDRDYGLLRWAPVFALTFLACWLLWRSRRERLSRAVPERLDVEIGAAMLLAICSAQVIVAAFAAPVIDGFWFPARHLIAALPCAAALCAWGLRHAPRSGGVLCALTIAASVWLLAALRTASVDGWVGPPDGGAPWGPLDEMLPLYGTGSAYADAVAWAVAAALALLVAREWRHRRRAGDETQRAYSG